MICMGADLGRAGDAAAGEDGAQQIDEGDITSEFAFDSRHAMNRRSDAPRWFADR